LPDIAFDWQFRERIGKAPQHVPLPTAAGAVPEFKLHHRTPAGLSGRQGGFDPGANGRVAMRTQQVDPRRCVNENHPF